MLLYLLLFAYGLLDLFVFDFAVGLFFVAIWFTMLICVYLLFALLFSITVALLLFSCFTVLGYSIWCTLLHCLLY